MQDSAPISTLLTVGCHLSHQQSPTTPEERTAYKEYTNSFKYIEGIGTVLHSHAKHINICHHFIHEQIKNSEVDLKYCPTKDQLADIFTKQLPCEAFEKLRTTIGVREYW
jgi:hypothetical protein